MDTIIPQDDTPQKQCSKCKKWKDATNVFFARMKTGRYGLASICKICRSPAWQAEHPEARPKVKLPLPEGYKRCSKCKKELLATSDHFQKHSNGGLQPRCKQCRSEDGKEYDACHKEQASIREKKWRANNRARILARRRKNKDAINARRRMRYQQIPTVREQRLNSGREDYHKHKERHKATFHAYYLAHRQYYRMKDRERRAHEKRVPGIHTPAQIEEQLKRQKYRCYYLACGHAKFPRVKKNGKWEYIYDIEHTFPVSRVSGTGIPANDMGYLVLSCHSCNQKKGNKFPHEFFEGGRLF